MPTSLDTVAALKGHLNRIDDFMEHIRLAKSITPDAAMHAVFDHLLDEEAEHREAISDALTNAPQEGLLASGATQTKKALSNAPAEHREEDELISPFEATPVAPAQSRNAPLTVGSLYGQGQ